MSASPTYWKPVGVVAGLAIAMVVGFGIARLTAPVPEPSPVPTGSTAEPTEIKLDPSYLKVVGIATDKVTPGNLSADVLAPATVAAAPNGVAVVTAHAAGTIVRLMKQLGDAVRAGETLALVESKEAAAMAADVKVAESKASLAQSSLAREQDLYNQRVTPRQDLERAQAEAAVAEAELQRARESAAAAHVNAAGRIAVTSPLAGRITSATAALGTFVQAETELFRIADPKFIQIEAAVPAMDSQRIAAGDPARIATMAGESIIAEVRSVSPTVNEQTRSATVVLSVAGPHEGLAPGDFVQATITPKSTGASGFVVPEDAVQNVGGRDVVFVRTANGFRLQSVVLGSRGGGRVTVRSGLMGNETIATTNAFFLKAELGKGTGEDE